MKRMLVAGVGNIFLGDDAFGSEVARTMSGLALPEGVEVVDFGIRGVHLAYQLLDGYDVLVIVDAAPRGQPPGTVSLLDVSLDSVPDDRAAVAEGGTPLVDAHGLEPAAILSMLGSLGGRVDRVFVVACEPASVAEGIGLTGAVRAAVPAAVTIVERLVQDEYTSAEEASI